MREEQTLAITYRPAVKSDIPLILRFVRELAEYEKLIDQVCATTELFEDALFGAEQRAHVLLAYCGSEPAGFACYYFSFSTFIARPGLYLDDLYVSPQYRGKGIGKGFFRELAAIAKEKKCGRFEWIVLDWNDSAIKFYRGLGAKPLSEWTTHRLTSKEISDLSSSRL